ncbi:hypothetical protein MTO96_043031 [Rhipicephalus appendiculatus]
MHAVGKAVAAAAATPEVTHSGMHQTRPLMRAASFEGLRRSAPPSMPAVLASSTAPRHTADRAPCFVHYGNEEGDSLEYRISAVDVREKQTRPSLQE